MKTSKKVRIALTGILLLAILIVLVSLYPKASAVYRIKNYTPTEQEQEIYEHTLNRFLEDDELLICSQIEAVPCTIVSYKWSRTHGVFNSAVLIYRPGAPLKQGTIIELPQPQVNAMGKPGDIEDMQLSWDGLTLSYICRFDNKINQQGFPYPEEHPLGTYYYTTNLLTGETAERFVPEES